MKYNKTELQLQGPPVEDLCKPRHFANRPNFEPTPAPEVQVRAGMFILPPGDSAGGFLLSTCLNFRSGQSGVGASRTNHALPYKNSSIPKHQIGWKMPIRRTD